VITELLCAGSNNANKGVVQVWLVDRLPGVLVSNQPPMG
jgi:hypothetical protein